MHHNCPNCSIPFSGVRGVLDPPVLAANLLAGVRAVVPHRLAARHDPRRPDRAHGVDLLHHGAHHRAIPRRLLSIPAQEVRLSFFRSGLERGTQVW